MATAVSATPPCSCSAQPICIGSGKGLTEVREGAHLQGIRLCARLHFQPVSCLFSRLNHEGRLGISCLSCAGLLEEEMTVHMLQRSILSICPKLQIYLPDLDRGWGFLCLLFGLLSLWKAGDVAMPRGRAGCTGWLGKALQGKGVGLKRLCWKVSLGSDFFSNSSKQLLSCLNINFRSAFLLLCDSWSFFSHLQAYPRYLITNFAIKKVVVLATSPLDSSGDHAWLDFASLKLSEDCGAGDNGAMSCMHSWAVSLVLADDLDGPMSLEGFQKTHS